MTKSVVYVGGPSDGLIDRLDINQTSVTVVDPLQIKGNLITLTDQPVGVYQQTGEYSGMNEIFTWRGRK